MRTIDLSTTNANLTEILSLAGDETVIIRTPDGREFVLSEVDDFAYEVAILCSKSRTDGISYRAFMHRQSDIILAKLERC